MYGHPSNPDPYSTDYDPTDFVAAVLTMTVVIGPAFFALGYFGSVWGWF